METLTRLHHALQPYYSVIAIVLTWVALGVAWRRRRGQWMTKEFLGQVNFSLNLIGTVLWPDHVSHLGEEYFPVARCLASGRQGPPILPGGPRKVAS